MLDDDHRGARVDQPIERKEQLGDVVEMQPGSGLVEEVQRLASGTLDQVGGQRLGGLGGEEVGVGVGDLVELVLDRLDHGGMAVAEAGDRRPARSVEVAPARAVDDVGPVAADRHGIAVARRAVKDPALAHLAASPHVPLRAHHSPPGRALQKRWRCRNVAA